MLTVTSYGADGATFRQKFQRQGLFWFFRSLTAGYKLPGRVRQRATSLSAVRVRAVQAFAFVVFRILSVTCSLTRALSQSLAHAQQLRAEGLHFLYNSCHLLSCHIECTTCTCIMCLGRYGCITIRISVYRIVQCIMQLTL